ncbi:MAG TPA: rod shape-determining protein MreD [Egibacteraceae bacterium]|nr:rod shape-determining protein MreD [Egibacteraceae bacterium]
MIARVAMMAAVALTALLITTVMLPAFAIADWAPDLVALTVIAFAMSDGPETGARYGFAAGLLADLVSGGSLLLGQSALVLALVGYVVGLARPYLAGETMVSRAAAAGAAAAIVIAGHGLLGLLLEVGTVTFADLLKGMLIVGLYSAAVVPLVLRPVASLTSRFAGLPLPGPVSRRV